MLIIRKPSEGESNDRPYDWTKQTDFYNKNFAWQRPRLVKSTCDE